MSKNREQFMASSAKILALTLFLIGVILLIIAIYLNWKLKSAFFELLLIGITAISGSLFTAAISIVTFKQSGIIKFVREQAERVLLNDDYINGLSEDKLRKLKRKINGSIYNPAVATNDDSLLNYCEVAIDPLVGDHYFEKFAFEIKVEEDENGKFAIRKYEKSMRIIPTEKGKKGKIALRNILRGAVDKEIIEGENSIIISDFCVDGEKQDVGVKFLDDEKRIYKKEYVLSFNSPDKNDEIEIKPNGCDILLKFKITTDKTDNMIINKIDVPCKDYSARISYNNNKFDIRCVTYKFMKIDGMRCQKKVGGDFTISSPNWCLPGDGFVVQFIDKEA